VRALTKDLANVVFLPYQPREKLHELYNAASVHLITLRDEVAGLLVPSKYPAALAAGKAVVLVGGKGADFNGEIEKEAVGWVCEHYTASVISVLRAASRDPATLKPIGERARKLFERKYSRHTCTARWRELLLEVADHQ
jgi:glycosyltransferase involved in cell wall biosynthesis